MDISSIITFNIVLLAAILSPGPAFLYIMTTSLSRGRVAGFAAGLGLGAMAAIWTLLAILGLEVLINLLPGLYLSIRIAGALYLLWIAVGLWRDPALSDDDNGDGDGDGSTMSKEGLRRFFLRGFLINLMNPKSVVFAASVIVMIFPPDISIAAMMIVPANHLLIEFCFYFVFAFVFSRQAVRQGYLARRRLFNRVAAIAMAALALRMAFGG